MVKHAAKRWLSLLLVFAMMLSMSVTTFAANEPISVSVMDKTSGTARISVLEEWSEGYNTFDVTSAVPCVAFVVHENGTDERLYCAVVDEATGHHRFRLNAAAGDAICVGVKGDADLNGRVNILDLTRVNQYLGAQTSFDVVARYTSDVDSNGRENILDMTRINQYLGALYEWSWDIGWVIEPDIDGDGIPDSEDPDDDNDGIPDINDFDHPDYIGPDMDGEKDTDGDGISDYEDGDIDGDGILNDEDTDDDGDGIPDVNDPDSNEYLGPDTDGDGIIDSEDDDIDGDGIPNDEDTDDDGDGIPDVNDPDSEEYIGPDTDGDGIVDDEDNDIDGDGIPNDEDTDDNGDGILDIDDPNYPDYDPDSDGDGIRDSEDEDDDNDGIPDENDPDHPNFVDFDTDGDGIFDYLDDDIDGDGIPNWEDDDDDGDGVPDYMDDTTDTDGDGIPDSEDEDDDGDGIPDVNDPDHPLYDQDGDGIPDSEDTDDDEDGIPDVDDIDHPDYVDVNAYAVLRLAAAEDDIHIGNEAELSLTNDIEGEYEIEYHLVNNGTDIVIDVATLDDAGGTLLFDESTGVYSMYAVAKTATGYEVVSNTVDLNITNTAPEVSLLSASANYGDTIGGYGSDLLVWTDINVESVDADGDTYTLKSVHGDNFIPPTNAYYGDGVYYMGVYAVDQWGAESPVKYCAFAINTKTNVEDVQAVYTDTISIHVEDDFQVYVDESQLESLIASRWVLYDADDNIVGLDDSELGRLGGTLSIDDGVGLYRLQGIGIDEYDVEFDMGSVYITTTNEAPEVPTLSHTVEWDNVINEYTAQAKVWVDFSGIPGADAHGDDVVVYYSLNGSEYSTTLTGDYFTVGKNTVNAYTQDEWGAQSEVATYSFTVSNNGPAAPKISHSVDWNKVTNPYKDNASVWVNISGIDGVDDHDDKTITYYSLNGSAYSTTISGGYFKAGSNTVTAYSVDRLNTRGTTATYNFNVSSGITASIVKPSVFGSGYNSTGTSVTFNVTVKSPVPYRFAWLDFYENGKPVKLNGYGQTATSQRIGQTTWTRGNHMLVVQAMSILGEAAYDVFFFTIGQNSSSGSAGISGNGVTTMSTKMVDDKGQPLCYVSGFTVGVPTISGHSTGATTTDTLTVRGVKANGTKVQLVHFPSEHAYCSITASNGSGSWRSDHSSNNKGSFTFDTNAYVALEFTFYSPHPSCMNRGGASLTYVVNYDFGSSSEALGNLAALFAGI